MDDITKNAVYQAHLILMEMELHDKKYKNLNINDCTYCLEATEEERVAFMEEIYE